MSGRVRQWWEEYNIVQDEKVANASGIYNNTAMPCMHFRGAGTRARCLLAQVARGERAAGGGCAAHAARK